jgi:hypothetical protein
MTDQFPDATKMPPSPPSHSLTGLPVTSGSIIVAGDVTAARIVRSPTAWRLARRNGELVLQAGSIWTQGREYGIEWNDAPAAVNLDELEAPNA